MKFTTGNTPSEEQPDQPQCGERGDQPAAENRWNPGSLIPVAAAIGTIGLAAWVAGTVDRPRNGFGAYLFAYVSVLTLLAGALFQLMMSHVTGANWFTMLRRLALVVAGALPAMIVLLVPVLMGIHHLYSWASYGVVPLAERHLASQRESWLNPPFFVARALLYVALLVLFAALLRRASVAEDSARNAGAIAAATAHQRRMSAAGLVACGLAVTFVAFDWLMPLDPQWYSTVFGVYVFSGGFLGALGMLGLLAYRSVRSGALNGVLDANHFGALGKLTLTFAVFWFYIGFAQYLIIWIGDIPADASWYVTRGKGGWGLLGLALAAGQFAVPLVVLLPSATKRNARLMGWMGAWLVAMHVADTYWMVLPAIHPTRALPDWMDVAALAGVGGWVTAFGAWRAAGTAAIPMRSPAQSPSENYAEP